MASLSVYRAGYEKASPGFSEGIVVRDFYYIHYVSSGKGYFESEGRRFPVSAGDAYLVYPHIPIADCSDENEPWEIWWVGFNGNDAHLMIDATRFTRDLPVITPQKPDRMFRLIKEIYKCRGEKVHELLSMTGKLYSLLSFLIEDADPDLEPSSHRPGVMHIRRACDYIQDHYADDISIGDIAAYVNLSRSQLFRLFKEHVSLSPSQYLTEFRIRESCNLLNKKPLSIKEIAFAVGFEDPHYFYSVFKNVTGKTPGEYIKQLGKGTPQATASSSSRAQKGKLIIP